MEHQESIEDIRIKFEQWRLTRKNRCERIPASLWKSAAALTNDHSINVVAKALRLNGNDLKKHVQKHCDQHPIKENVPSDFVELTWEPPSLSQSEFIVELADPAGSRMRISIKGNNNLDVPGLIESFWKRGR